MISQAIINIAEICSRHGNTQAVLSPGSRCAPLTLSFVRHPGITPYNIIDERSAAFIALGLAQSSGKAALLVCTSGSAAYNYAPAVAEAWFSNTPLIVFTADRPPEWIDQEDGQTIYQEKLYGGHVKKSISLPVSTSHPDDQWFVERSINEAILLAEEHPRGPVHINIPFREPFYPEGLDFKYDANVRVIQSTSSSSTFSLSIDLIQTWNNSSGKLIVGGQSDLHEDIIQALELLHSKNIPVVGDMISNLRTWENCIAHHDLFLKHEPEALKPDLLVTFGGQVLSKPLKLFLRKFKPVHHWHIQSPGPVADTFQNLTRIFRADTVQVLRQLAKLNSGRSEYFSAWKEAGEKSKDTLHRVIRKSAFTELQAVASITENLKSDTHLHLANSMAVRYFNFFTLKDRKITVHANRGTSGIDGSTSTAIGHSLVNKQLNVLVTGDLAFFYDRNAFWNNYIPDNFKVIVLNNHGGRIFGLIPGADALPETEREPWFETPHQLDAFHLANEFGLTYHKVSDEKELQQQLSGFLDPESGKGILEIVTDPEENKQIIHTLNQAVQ